MQSVKIYLFSYKSYRCYILILVHRVPVKDVRDKDVAYWCGAQSACKRRYGKDVTYWCGPQSVGKMVYS